MKKNQKEYTDEELEVNRRISLGLYALSIALTFLMIILLFNVEFNTLIMGPIMIVMVLAFVFATELKFRILPHMAKSLMDKIHTDTLTITYSQQAGIPEKYFREANFIKKYDRYQSFDFILGKLKEKDFILSGLSIKALSKTTEKKELQTIYSGIFGMTDFLNEDNIDMIIAPDVNNKFLNGIFEDMKKSLGMNQKVVRLENPEFERYFEVFCNDQVNARKIITLSFMEKMVHFRELIRKDITLIYKNHKIYFFVDNRLVVDSNKLYFRGINEETIYETTEFIKLLGEIVANVATSRSDMK
jgi:hypothetical protein